MVEESAVSQDHLVCTWLSGGMGSGCRIAVDSPPPSTGSARPPVLSSALPTVVPMSTAAPPSEITGSVHTEALAVLRELTGRPDAVFREGQDAAVSALVERSQRALVR